MAGYAGFAFLITALFCGCWLLSVFCFALLPPSLPIPCQMLWFFSCLQRSKILRSKYTNSSSPALPVGVTFSQSWDSVIIEQALAWAQAWNCFLLFSSHAECWTLALCLVLQLCSRQGTQPWQGCLEVPGVFTVTPAPFWGGRMGREERTCAGTQSAAHLPGDEEQPLAVGCGLLGSAAALGAVRMGWPPPPSHRTWTSSARGAQGLPGPASRGPRWCCSRCHRHAAPAGTGFGLGHGSVRVHCVQKAGGR